jgi:hypothetical protein
MFLMSLFAGIAGLFQGATTFLQSQFNVLEIFAGISMFALGIGALVLIWKFGSKATSFGWKGLSATGSGVGKGVSGLFGLFSRNYSLQPSFGALLVIAGLIGTGFGWSEWRTPDSSLDLTKVTEIKKLASTTVEDKKPDGSSTVREQIDQSLFATLMNDMKTKQANGEINTQRVPRSMSLGLMLGSLGFVLAGTVCSTRGLHYNNQVAKMAKATPNNIRA